MSREREKYSNSYANGERDGGRANGMSYMRLQRRCKHSRSRCAHKKPRVEPGDVTACEWM